MNVKLQKARRQLNKLSQQVEDTIASLKNVLNATQFEYIKNKLRNALILTIEAYYDVIIASSSSDTSEWTRQLSNPLAIKHLRSFASNLTRSSGYFTNTPENSLKPTHLIILYRLNSWSFTSSNTATTPSTSYNETSTRIDFDAFTNALQTVHNPLAATRQFRPNFRTSAQGYLSSRITHCSSTIATTITRILFLLERAFSAIYNNLEHHKQRKKESVFKTG